MMLTQKHLQTILRYEPDTGIFTWLVNPTKRFKAGLVAGYLKNDGYRWIKVDGRKYAAHRLAFLSMMGRWPSQEIDHRNGVRADNRWENLREATRAENRQNRAARSNNRAGLLGVFWDAQNRKWQAQISSAGKRIFLGRFKDKQAAHAAYLEAKVKIHTFAARAAK